MKKKGHRIYSLPHKSDMTWHNFLGFFFDHPNVNQQPKNLIFFPVTICCKLDCLYNSVGHCCKRVYPCFDKQQIRSNALFNLFLINLINEIIDLGDYDLQFYNKQDHIFLHWTLELWYKKVLWYNKWNASPSIIKKFYDITNTVYYQ